MYLAPAEKAPSPAPEPGPEKAPEIDEHAAVPVAPVVATNGAESPCGGAPGGPAPAEARPPPRHRVVVSRAPVKGPTRAPPTEQTLVKVLPLTELLEEPVDHAPRRRDRRADSLRDKEERRRRRSRSWERRARARRHPHNDERRRPASRSPSPRGRYRNRSPPPALLDRVGSRSRSRSPVPVREREHERERDRLRVPRELERDRMSRDREHRDRLSHSRDRERSRDRSRDRSRGSASPRDTRIDHNDVYKRRCKDFDEKGYCMRGDLCQWDHGTDPLVLEDAALTRVLTVPPAVPEYNPLTPDIWMGGGGFGGFPHPHPPPHPPHPPRELIPIPSFAPRLRHEAPPRHPPPHSHKKPFDYNRLGAQHTRPPLPANAANCSLEVKKVPRGLNDITHLNNHFSKFGKIVNIQVCFEGDPEAALITFSTPTEANVAFKSTEAVLNNRFIKVFWHKPEQNKQENTAPVGQQQAKPNDRQNNNNQHPMSHNKVLINRDNIKATADIKQANAEKQAKEATNGQEPKKEVTKPVDKSKQVMEMMKRAQALLEKQLQQQLLLIEKLESGNISDSQKAALMEAINSAQEGIEKLRNELFAYNGTLRQMQANAKKPKTRQEAEKEILDAELDMFTKQQEGQDVTELAKKVADLRRQMAIQFPSHPAMRRPHSSFPHNRGGRFNPASRFVRGGAAKVFSANQSVDHRPRALLISGFEADEQHAVIQHFMQYGEVTSKEVNLSVPELVVQYAARAHAELAAAHGKHYNDRTLSITWVANTKAYLGNVAESRPQAQHNGESNEENKEPEPSQDTSTDALLRFDEEEEEDAEEDRSWRR
ncbi:hypothetical protein ABMA28_011578 [Loxostege sticticalis]|uniref:C3H1-type domain-containing protein n=1 Tax=Loxostege sticticalis TaxID=481309 RepID=A0ABD0S5M9_LOXSC